MKKIRTSIVIGLAIIVTVLALTVTGCTSSLNPIYTEEGVLFRPDLVGKWKYEEDKHGWELTKKEDEKAYLLTSLDKEEQDNFTVHLTKIGEHHFLDLYENEINYKNLLYKPYRFPAHLLIRADIDRDTIILEGIDSDWLAKGIEAGTVNIDHVKSPDGNILITASTDKLQQFVVEHADDEQAFQGFMDMARME